MIILSIMAIGWFPYFFPGALEDYLLNRSSDMPFVVQTFSLFSVFWAFLYALILFAYGKPPFLKVRQILSKRSFPKSEKSGKKGFLEACEKDFFNVTEAIRLGKPSGMNDIFNIGPMVARIYIDFNGLSNRDRISF